MDDAPVKKEPMPSGIRPPNDLEASLGRIGGRTLSGDDELSHGAESAALGGLGAQMAAAAAAASSNQNAVSQLVNNSLAGMSGSRSPLSAGYHDEGSLLALAAAAAGAGGGGPNEPKFYEWDSMRMTQKMLQQQQQQQHSPSEMNHAGGGGVDHDASLGSDETGNIAAEVASQATKQSLRTLEKLLLSPHGASVAATMGGDVAAAAAALANAGAGAGLDPSVLGNIDVHTLSQHAMAIFQQQQLQQQQQQQSSTPSSSGAGILPSMATFVGNSASSLQRRYVPEV